MKIIILFMNKIMNQKKKIFQKYSLENVLKKKLLYYQRDKGIMHNKFKIDNLYFEKIDIKEIKLITDLKEINYKGSKIDIVNKDKPKLLSFKTLI